MKPNPKSSITNTGEMLAAHCLAIPLIVSIIARTSKDPQATLCAAPIVGAAIDACGSFDFTSLNTEKQKQFIRVRGATVQQDLDRVRQGLEPLTPEVIADMLAIFPPTLDFLLRFLREGETDTLLPKLPHELVSVCAEIIAIHDLRGKIDFVHTPFHEIRELIYACLVGNVDEVYMTMQASEEHPQ